MDDIMQSWTDFLNALAENIESVGNVTNTLINETTGVQRNIISQNYALQDMYYQRLLAIYQNLADLIDHGETTFEMSASGGYGFYRIVSGGDLYLVTIQSGNSADSMIATSQHFTIHAKLFRKYNPDFIIPVIPNYSDTTSDIYAGVIGNETGYTYTIRMYDSTGYLNPYQADVGGAGLSLRVRVSKSTSDDSIPVIPQGSNLSDSYYVGGLANSNALTTDNVNIENPWDYYNNILKPQLDDNLRDSTLPDEQKNDLYVFPNGYDPNPPADEGIDDTEKGTGENLPNFGLKLAGAVGFTSYYLLSYQGIGSIQNALSVVTNTFWEALGTTTDYSQSNLLKYVMSLKWYPIDILSGNQGLYADTKTTSINFAFNQNTQLPIQGDNYKLGTTMRVYNMGSISIPYKLGHETFLDKDPYTTVNIWLPFCGLYPLKADYVVGNTIAINYVIDLTTGMCTAIVTNDRNTLLNVTGKIGVDYAVSGNDVITQSERIAGSYVNGAMSVINGAISLGTAAMSENIAGAVSATAGIAGSIAKSSIDIASAKRAVPVAVSSGSGFGACFAPNSPSIIVNPPAVKIPSNYGHTNGYVYNQSAVIGSLSGFVVCNNPDLSNISATQTEKNEIYSILTSGIYV